MNCWYVLSTKLKEEERARSNLEFQGYKTYLPRIPAKAVKSETKKVPMFPRYIFAYLDTGICNLSAIRYTRGVLDFVRFGDSIAIVTDSVMRSIEQTEQIFNELQRPPKKGDKVSLVSGPFKGVDAVFFSQKSEQRVIILMNILHKLVRLEVGVGDICLDDTARNSLVSVSETATHRTSRQSDEHLEPSR